METKVLFPTEENIKYCGELLKSGELVGMPTETVYGLGANAYDDKAVEKIFIAKGRPQDNPLIVHISSMKMLDEVVEEIPEVARNLAEKFWPGPLTMIFKKSGRISQTITAGLDTVAVRYPSHLVARKLIAEAGCPVAAPSANISGHPSTTKAEHVYSDLKGKIKAILDGGSCEYGLESTVILLQDNGTVRLLRPGAVTVEMLKTVVKEVIVDNGVLHEVKEGERALSPGMLHKHYSPTTNVVIVDSSLDEFVDFVNNKANLNVGALVFDEEEKLLNVPTIAYGSKEDMDIQAKKLFNALRKIDELNVKTVYARMPKQDGIGLAVYNRLIRAAGFEVITL